MHATSVIHHISFKRKQSQKSMRSLNFTEKIRMVTSVSSYTGETSIFEILVQVICVIIVEFQSRDTFSTWWSTPNVNAVIGSS